jgi:starch synthase
MTSPLSVFFLASEAEPFVKVGGLGDVAGSLPRALRQQGIDIRLVIPFHGTIRRSEYDLRLVAAFDLPHSSGPIPTEVYATQVDGLPVYLISGSPFQPDAPVYSNDWGFDAHKYIFFSLAALELARTLNWQPRILHANDWHTAAAVYWLALNRAIDPFYQQTASLLSVHNLPYLGTGGSAPLGAFGLPPATKSLLPEWARHLPLPLGLLTADSIAAVSPTYALEMLTPEFGSGLHEFLRTRAEVITGILNGLDQDYWNPAKDAALTSPFDPTNLTLRGVNKIALQQEWNLPPDPTIPLLAFIGRLNHQKGVDLALDALHRLVDYPWQVIFLGTGVPELEDAIRLLQRKYPERVRAVIRFDAALSHRMYAGADALLVPSRYEPCGLVQMIAMRYGCVPIARATGGLKDTVFENPGNQANGFLFNEPRPDTLAEAIRRAINTFAYRPRWQELQHQGMQQDFSWERSAREYESLYQKLMKERHP